MTLTSTGRISEITYQWYLTRVPGAKNGTPLGTLQMTYWKSVSGAKVSNAVKTLDEAETVWLRNLIAGQGLTPNTNCSRGQLWQQLMAAFNLGKAVSKKDAERLFYLSTGGSNP